MPEAEVATTLTHALLAAVPTLEPVIRASTADLDQATIPDELVRAFEEAGIYDAWFPPELTGKEIDGIDWLQAIEAISRIDGSAGWLAFIGGANVRMLAWDAETIERFRETTGGRFSSAVSGMPRGRAIPVEGGYRLTGRWSFASSAPVATWHGGGALVFGEDGPQFTPDGRAKLILALWPATESTLHKTWDGLGLRGTGSDDIEVVDLFIPANQVREEFLAVTWDSPAMRVREFPGLTHGAHALGVAQAALDDFARIVSSRPVAEAPKSAAPVSAPMGHLQSHRMVFAKADAMVRAARGLFYSAVETALASVVDAEEVPLEYKVALRQANVFAVRSSREAVDLLFQIAGTGAVYRGGVLERAFRDIATGANHFQVVESQYESVGSYLLTKDAADGPILAGMPFP